MEPNPTTATLLRDAAIHIIDERGEAALRVTDVVREVGVDVSSLYHFFGNREGLIEAAHLERFLKDFRNQFDSNVPLLLAAESLEEVKRAVDQLMAQVWSPEGREVRMRRINVLGACQFREVLTKEICEVEMHVEAQFASMIRLLQERGFFRQDIDPVATGSWIMGMTLGRILVELGSTNVSSDDWNFLAREATYVVLFGEPPARA